MSEAFETACPQCAYNEMRRLAIAQGLDPEKFLRKPITPTDAEWRALLEKLVEALRNVEIMAWADDFSERVKLDEIDKIVTEALAEAKLRGAL